MFDPELHERRVLKEMGENPTEYHYVFTKDNPYVQASKVLMHDQRIAVESTADELKAAILHWRNTALHQELEKIGWSFDEDDIQELLWNAFEHGSEWCEKGPVNIRVLCNQDKTILGVLIEQPLEGFDVERIAGHTQTEISEVLSGGGLSNVKNSLAVIGFEEMQGVDLKFRTIAVVRKSRVDE